MYYAIIIEKNNPRKGMGMGRIRIEVKNQVQLNTSVELDEQVSAHLIDQIVERLHAYMRDVIAPEIADDVLRRNMS